MKFLRFWAALLIAAFTASAVELTPEQRQRNADSFEYAWSTIQKFMWEPMPAGVDWVQIHDELKPKVAAATTMEEARGLIRDMISRLKMTHFGIVPGDVYERLDAGKTASQGGSPGFDLRLVQGAATVISVERDSPAFASGVRPGWRVTRAGGEDTQESIAKLREAFRDSTVKELLITRSLMAQLDGPPGARIPVVFTDGQDRRIELAIQLKEPRGASSKIGFLPAQHVWYESKKLGNTGYVAFNMFLDPARIANRFGDSVQSCLTCDGIVIDLRGNPGGIGGMSMGMAGWFISEPNVQLGTMKTKKDEMKFAVNPRSPGFRGPLAILVDGLTGSTSEIFAEGLKDLGRARVFGSRTAGAALPSVFEKLPNGDGFQYAIANYVSQNGKPLEGIGVIPDVEVPLTREALLAGRDPVLDAALDWIGKQKQNHKEGSK